VITVIARKYIARLEPNPFIINPFVKCEILKDPATKRGFLYLSSVFKLIDAQQDIFNKQLDALGLIINKPYLAPKGAFSGKIEMKEGSIIEYDPALMQQMPQPLDFSSALRGWDFMDYFRSITESTTGIYKNMSGAVESGGATATEIQARVGGQTTRLSMVIDVINQDFIIPIIEKAAELIANYEFDDTEMLVEENGTKSPAIVNEAIRQGKYKYTYADRGAVQEKRLRLKDNLPILQQMIPALMPYGLDIKEMSKDILEQLGFENVERYFNVQQPQQPNAFGVGADVPNEGMAGVPQLPQDPNLQPTNGQPF
jgi:hypothetical protein